MEISFNPRGSKPTLHPPRINRIRSFLAPTACAADLRKSALLSLGGVLIAGGFGIVHDQVTFTISPEYFTRMKFDQFRWADVGFSERVFVAEIGFLATWWVGLIAGWFLARIAVRKFENPVKQVTRALVIMVGITLACGVLGYFLGPAMFANRKGWLDALREMEVTDFRAFHQVSGIHLGSYVGALLGWIAMMAWFLKAQGGGGRK